MHVWIESMIRHTPMGEMIERFRLESTNRKASAWIEHRDINMVRLATSLAPDGYLTL